MAGVPFLSFASQKPEGEQKQDSNDTSFEFSFVTDIHLQPEMNAPLGFQMAIDKVNELNSDFVITGGDLVFDVMRGDYERSETLFDLYQKMCKGFRMPVHHSVGNHDLFAIYPESPEKEDHPDYKYGMWERYFGKTYYSFDHKGWHFIVLNSLDVTEEKGYKGIFQAEQLDWLAEDLKNVAQTTPIVVTTHIPMLTAYWQLSGKRGNVGVENSDKAFKLLENHNLKLLLQGHIHWKESGIPNDRFEFVTGGSIAGNGWKGRRHNTKEGFVQVKVRGENFSWEYIDHGWEDARLKLANAENSEKG